MTQRASPGGIEPFSKGKPRFYNANLLGIKINGNSQFCFEYIFLCNRIGILILPRIVNVYETINPLDSTIYIAKSCLYRVYFCIVIGIW